MPQTGRQRSAIPDPMGSLAFLLGTVFACRSEPNLGGIALHGAPELGSWLDVASPPCRMGDRVFARRNTFHAGTHVRRPASLRPVETRHHGKHLWRPRCGSVLPEFSSEGPHPVRADVGCCASLRLRD